MNQQPEHAHTIHAYTYILARVRAHALKHSRRGNERRAIEEEGDDEEQWRSFFYNSLRGCSQIAELPID